MRIRWMVAALVSAVAVAPVVLRAPRTRPDPGVPRTVTALAEAARAGGASGWDLVAEATAQVARAFGQRDAWHLLEPATMALRHGHGQATQYNVVLAAVLRELGFDVCLVHSAWVRWDVGAAASSRPIPWFYRGHLWVRVTCEGRTRDVCASAGTNTPGAVPFVPVSEVRPARGCTPVWVAGAQFPFVVGEVWREILTGDEPAPWLGA